MKTKIYKRPEYMGYFWSISDSNHLETLGYTLTLWGARRELRKAIEIEKRGITVIEEYEE